ncbi:hypothetical protein ACFQ7N_10750 [Streptomyces niveus]|uniref:hypothetical protein n=1 Tax=Streptomyces niveus TaxID=193462 RepID=UPI0036C0C1E6
MNIKRTAATVVLPQPDDPIAALLDAAATLQPTAGYINGLDYTQWHVEAPPELLRALAELATTRGDDNLAAQLNRFAQPLCMEPLDTELTYESAPRRWCGTPVERDDEPCAAHTPEHAASLGRCTYIGDVYEAQRRICREPLLSGTDRCRGHHGRCRAIRKDGKVCGRPDCQVPKHRASVEVAAR